MAINIKNKRSSVVNKAPDPGALAAGEIAVNYNANSPALYIEDAGGSVVKIANGVTDLGTANVTTTTLDVTNSTGTDATLPAATTSAAGLLSSADKTKLDLQPATPHWQRTGTTISPSTSGDNLEIGGTAEVDGASTFNAVVENTSGGYKFPDGTVQLTAADPAGQTYSLQQVTTTGNTTTNDIILGSNKIQLTAVTGDITSAGDIQVGGNPNSGTAAGSRVESAGVIKAAGSVDGDSTFEGYVVGTSTPTCKILADGSITSNETLTVLGSVAGVEATISNATIKSKINTGNTQPYFQGQKGNNVVFEASHDGGVLAAGDIKIGGTLPSAPNITLANTGSISANGGLNIGSGSYSGFAATIDGSSGQVFAGQINGKNVSGSADSVANTFAGINSSGTQTFSVKADGSINGGKLSIDTTSGARAITLNAPTNGCYVTFETAGTAFADIGSEKGAVGTGSADDLAINVRGSRDFLVRTNNLERMRLDSSGNVKVIGTGTVSAPNIELSANGLIATAGEVKVEGPNTPSGLSSRISKYGSLLIGTSSELIADAKTSIDSSSGTILTDGSITAAGQGRFGGRLRVDSYIESFRTGSSESAFTAYQSGTVNVNITAGGAITAAGTVESTNAAYGFKSSATSFPFTAESTLGNGGKAFFADHTGTGSSSSYLFYGQNSGGEVFSVATNGNITAAGNVEINNDIVFGNQSASGTGGTGRLVATGGEVFIQGGLAKTSGSSAPIVFTAYGGVNERMRLDSSGNLLLGGTLPSAPNIELSANGSITSAGSAQLTKPRSSTAGTNTGALCINPSDSAIYYNFRVSQVDNALRIDTFSGADQFLFSSTGGFTADGPISALSYTALNTSNNSYIFQAVNGTTDFGGLYKESNGLKLNLNDSAAAQKIVLDGGDGSIIADGPLTCKSTGNAVAPLTVKDSNDNIAFSVYQQASPAGEYQTQFFDSAQTSKVEILHESGSVTTAGTIFANTPSNTNSVTGTNDGTNATFYGRNLGAANSPVFATGSATLANTCVITNTGSITAAGSINGTSATNTIYAQGSLATQGVAFRSRDNGAVGSDNKYHIYADDKDGNNVFRVATSGNITTAGNIQAGGYNGANNSLGIRLYPAGYSFINSNAADNASILLVSQNGVAKFSVAGNGTVTSSANAVFSGSATIGQGVNIGGSNIILASNGYITTAGDMQAGGNPANGTAVGTRSNANGSHQACGGDDNNAIYEGFKQGSSTPRFKVFASGDANFYGTITAANVSDIRFKKNIEDANPQLEDVVSLGSQLKNYDWTDDAPLNDELRARRFLGLVAQEAEKVCPELTYTVRRTKQGEQLTPEEVIPAVYEEKIVPAVIGDDGEIIEPETTENVLVTPEQVIPATYEELDDSYKAINHDILVMKLLGAVAELSAKVEALTQA